MLKTSTINFDTMQLLFFKNTDIIVFVLTSYLELPLMEQQSLSEYKTSGVKLSEADRDSVSTGILCPC